MKYLVSTLDHDERRHDVEINIRSDANLKNVYLKCVNALIGKMRKENAITGNVKYHIEMPNIWINGGFANIWFTANEEVYDVSIERDGRTFV